MKNPRCALGASLGWLFAGVCLLWIIADNPSCLSLNAGVYLVEFFALQKTANRQPPTANRQPPTANRQPPTANRQSTTFYSDFITGILARRA